MSISIGQPSASALIIDFTDTLLNPDMVEGDRFGDSVAFLGENILVGAPEDGITTMSGGAAYLFDGISGSLLHRFETPVPGVAFGGPGIRERRERLYAGAGAWHRIAPR